MDLLRRWETRVPDPHCPSYMLLMALCAVSAQSIALKAVFNEDFSDDVPDYDSSLYFNEAVSRVPDRIIQPHDLDYLRSYGLLALYSLRQGDHGNFHRYLGLYHGSVAQIGFHDEARWPDDISITEVDDRRRFFWCVYRLEIHTAGVLGHMVRLPESQVSVRYPRITPAMAPETRAWTAGWDYITDLFRILEHTISNLRRVKDRRPALAGLCDGLPPTTLVDSLGRLKANKPRILLGINERSGSGDLQSNRCRYMSVQITCAEALVTIMTLLYCQAPAHEVMEVAEKFIEEVSQAPLIMFKVASSQIVYDLLGVGHMLHNASRHDGNQYRTEARRLIAFLADLVGNLELDIPLAAEIGGRLRGLADSAS